MGADLAPAIIRGLRERGVVVVFDKHFHPDVRAALRAEFGPESYISWQDWGPMPYRAENLMRVIALRAPIVENALVVLP